MIQELKYLKILVLGANGVGKTAILNKIGEEIFEREEYSTLAIGRYQAKIEVEQETYFFQFWDFKDELKIEGITHKFYRNANGALIVFDLSRPDTLNRAKFYLDSLRHYLPEEIPFILVANKVDLVEDLDSVINRREIIRYAKSRGGIYIEDYLDDLENLKIALIKLYEKILMTTH